MCTIRCTKWNFWDLAEDLQTEDIIAWNIDVIVNLFPSVTLHVTFRAALIFFYSTKHDSFLKKLLNLTDQHHHCFFLSLVLLVTQRSHNTIILAYMNWCFVFLLFTHGEKRCSLKIVSAIGNYLFVFPFPVRRLIYWIILIIFFISTGCPRTKSWLISGLHGFSARSFS